MANLIEKIEAKLLELGLVKLQEEVTGDTGTTVVTEAAPAVVVAEIIPNPIKISYSAIGAPVFSVSEDGTETPVEDGEWLLGNNKKIVITDGKLVSEVVVEEVEEVKSEGEAEAEVEMAEETPETKEVELSEADLAMAVKVRTALQNIDISKAGSYYISIDVDADLNVTYAAMSSNTYETLMAEQEQKIEEKVNELNMAFETKLADEKARYENIIEALQSGETKIKDKPEVEAAVKLSRAEVLKAQLLEKTKNNN